MEIAFESVDRSQHVVLRPRALRNSSDVRAQFVDQLGRRRVAGILGGDGPELRDARAASCSRIAQAARNGRIAEESPHEVARGSVLARKVGERVGAAVPREHVPAPSAHVGGRRIERVKHARARVRSTRSSSCGARVEREAREQIEMTALVGGQPQRARDAAEHVGRDVDRQALLEPRVPRRADVGEQRDFFAPQSRRPAPRAVGQSDVGRHDFRAARA